MERRAAAARVRAKGAGSYSRHRDQTRHSYFAVCDENDNGDEHAYVAAGEQERVGDRRQREPEAEWMTVEEPHMGGAGAAAAAARPSPQGAPTILSPGGGAMAVPPPVVAQALLERPLAWWLLLVVAPG